MIRGNGGDFLQGRAESRSAKRMAESTSVHVLMPWEQGAVRGYPGTPLESTLPLHRSQYPHGRRRCQQPRKGRPHSSKMWRGQVVPQGGEVTPRLKHREACGRVDV